MGLITSLIDAHDEHKSRQRKEDMERYTYILNAPDDVMPRNVKLWASQGLAGVASKAIDGKQAHTDLFHKMISGMLNLNPAPGRDKPANGPMPAYKPIDEAGAKKIRADKADEAEGQKLKDKKLEDTADEELKARQQTQKLAELEEWLKTDPGVSETDKVALRAEARGLKAPPASARASGVWTKQRVKVPDDDGGFSEKELYHNNKTNEWTTLQGEPFDLPEGSDVAPDKRSITDPADVRKFRLIYKAANPHGSPLDEDRFVATQLGVDINQIRQGRAEGIATKEQTIGMNNELAGGVVSAPPAPYTPIKPPPTTQMPRDPSGLVARPPLTTTSAVTTKAATKTATKTPPGKPNTTPAPPTAPAGTSIVSQNATIEPGKIAVANILKDQNVNDYLGTVLGIPQSGGRGAAGRVSYERGRKKFLAAFPGVNQYTIEGSLAARKGTVEALTNNQKNLGALEGLSKQLDLFNNMILELRQKVSDNPPFLQKIVNAFNKNITGDPDTAKYVLGMQGVLRFYGRLIAGGYMSIAQTHVGAQETANQTFGADLMQGQLQATVDQMNREALNERVGLIDNSVSLFKELGQPLGQETAATGKGGSEDLTKKGDPKLTGAKLPMPTEKGQRISREQAMQYYNEYGKDARKAEAAAVKNGFSVEVQ